MMKKCALMHDSFYSKYDICQSNTYFSIESCNALYYLGMFSKAINPN